MGAWRCGWDPLTVGGPLTRLHWDRPGNAEGIAAYFLFSACNLGVVQLNNLWTPIPRVLIAVLEPQYTIHFLKATIGVSTLVIENKLLGGKRSSRYYRIIGQAHRALYQHEREPATRQSFGREMKNRGYHI